MAANSRPLITVTETSPARSSNDGWRRLNQAFIVISPLSIHPTGKNPRLWRKSVGIRKSRPSALSMIGETGMAYIEERGAYWRAEVRRKGYKPTYRTFDTQRQAQQWARRV